MAKDELSPSICQSDAYSRYETGLRQLRNRVEQDHPRYSEFLVYQQRLTDNIEKSRRYGDTQERKAEHSETIDHLNELTRSVLGIPFTDLCELRISATRPEPSERLPTEKHTEHQRDTEAAHAPRRVRLLLVLLVLDFPLVIFLASWYLVCGYRDLIDLLGVAFACIALLIAIMTVGGSAARSMPEPLPSRREAMALVAEEDRLSIQRQLDEARENLDLIKQRQAEYVLSTDIPLQLVKEERRLLDRIAELKQKLAKPTVPGGPGPRRGVMRSTPEQSQGIFDRLETRRHLTYIIPMPIVAFIVTAVRILLSQPSCQAPISATQVLIKPRRDVELVSVVGLPVTGAHGMVRSQGIIEISGLAPGRQYVLTLNGRRCRPLNSELCEISGNPFSDNLCKVIGVGYWDFMTVTADLNGIVSNQVLMAYLPDSVELCSGQVYSAKFFVKDVESGYRPALGNDDFPFTLEPLSSTLLIPRTLSITISNEVAKGHVIDTAMEVTGSSFPLDPIPVKGDSPVTVTVQALDERQNVIPPSTLTYCWDLCCQHKKPMQPSDTHQSVWGFQPPTYLQTETLTVTVSNSIGHSISAVIPFTITER